MDNRASEKNGTTVPPHSNNRSITDSECGVSEFLDDLVSLAELQLELTFVDFTKNARKAALPLALTLSSLTVTAATVPLLLHGLSLLIATWLNIQQGWAALLVATGTAALALPAAGFGVVCLRRGFDSFSTSKEELKRNLVWIRRVLIARRRSRHRRGVIH